jgi:glycosyltransferase involved in cell wall biosynthesis
MPIDISVVIPAFNEEATIGFLLDKIHNTLSDTGLSYELIVVNDGSSDRTSEATKDHDVILVENEKNSGKGVALKRGFMKAKGRFIVTMDADGSHRPAELPSLLKPLLSDDGVDSVLGVRFHNEDGRMTTSRLHLFGNKIINIIIYFLTRKYVSDTQCGYRALRKEALNFEDLTSKGFEIESEILVKLLNNGNKVLEVPINCKKRKNGLTRIRSYRDGATILKTVFKNILF